MTCLAEKIRAVPHWRDSGAFTELERLVLEYAEAMTATPPSVTDEMAERLRGHLGEPQLVELTAIVAVENLRSRINAALGLTAQGFKDQCEIAGTHRQVPPSGVRPATVPDASDAPGLSDADVFEAHRDLMFAVAYRMLGTITDAEDAVQDAWLRWSARTATQVADPRAYLARIAVNTALNRLRAVRARREAYVGPWLPEPLLTETGPDPADRAELAESVSMAMLVVLESLTPDERAVFVLREVFGFSHAEIAAALGRPDAAVRQLAHRAREHVQARRPRFDVDWNQQREVTDRFLAAAAGGDIEGLVSVLAPSVTLLSDGGGKTRAALRPITGAAKVARFIAGIATRPYMGTDGLGHEHRRGRDQRRPRHADHGGRQAGRRPDDGRRRRPHHGDPAARQPRQAERDRQRPHAAA